MHDPKAADAANPELPEPSQRPAPAPDAAAMASLSETLRSVVEAADGQPMTVGQILDRLGDRGGAMLIVVITLPFLLLPTTFGLSAPMGLAVAVLGLCQIARRRPWLPGFLRRREIPFQMLERTMRRAASLSDRIERVARPRLNMMLWPGPHALVGVNLIVWGLLMGLPGPNNVFAAMILLLAFGLLLRDGVLLLIAHLLTFSAPVLGFIYRHEIWTIFLEPVWERLFSP